MRKLRWLVSIPPSQWPLRWHAVVAATALAGISAALYVADRRFADRERQALQEVAELKAQLAASQAATQRRPSAEPPLPGPAQLDAVMRDFSELADERAVKLVSVRIEHEASRAGVPLQEIKLHAKAAGDYGAVKPWLSEVLARHASLALGSASFRRASADGNRLDADLTFVLFVKVSQ